MGVKESDMLQQSQERKEKILGVNRRWKVEMWKENVVSGKKVFEMQVLVGEVPMGSVRIEGEERSEPSAKVQYHGYMAEARKIYVRREDR